MPSIAQFQNAGTIIRFDADIVPEIDPDVFEVERLHSNGMWLASTPGRSQAHFFVYGEREMVLRHFHRGGLVGRVNRDFFVRVNPRNSRAFREFDLLRMMHAKGLPVPRPVAARFVPAGLFYRADIITERIPNARPLTEVLCDVTLPTQVWADIGATIKTLHDHKVFHSDLNARNILIDSDHRAWIIDFDKCYEREAGSWMKDNLDRLHRSLTKSKTQCPDLFWGAQEWQALLSGYAGKVQDVRDAASLAK